MARALQDTSLQDDPAAETADYGVCEGESTSGFAFSDCAMRYGLLALGWFMVALGIIGLIVPGFPGTVFLLIALWAFSKCSERFHDWLYNHKTLGPPIRGWHQHRAIPRYAKVAAVATMSASFAVTTIWVAESWMLPAGLAACFIPIVTFILTRPSHPAV